MKRMFMVMGLFVLLFTAARAQEKKFGTYAVGFYNQENLSIPFMTRGKRFRVSARWGYEMERNEVFREIEEHGHCIVEMGTTSCPISVRLSSGCLRLRTAV